MPARKKPVLPDELVDQLMSGRDPSTVFDKNGLLDELKRAIAERALNTEMDHHLASEAADGSSNSRNGYGTKNGADQYRQARDLGATGPALNLRSAADRQVSPPAAGLRREDRVPPRPAGRVPFRERIEGLLAFDGPTPPTARRPTRRSSAIAASGARSTAGNPPASRWRSGRPRPMPGNPRSAPASSTSSPSRNTG